MKDKQSNIFCSVCHENKQPHARRMCQSCYSKWYRSTHIKQTFEYEKNRREHYNYTFTTNKSCSSYLGVHVAEQVLSKVFKNVEIMPLGNPGYDFVCNHGKKIDVKSACVRKNATKWEFKINKNKSPDYFLCIAFDNREDLNPLHLWLIPGNMISHLRIASITESTLDKWNAYKLDISKTLQCCDSLH